MMAIEETIFFVVPEFTVDINEGGGQRTQLILDAALTVGPVEVIVIGCRLKDDYERIFAGARAVHVVKTDALMMKGGSLVSRMAENARRLISVGRDFEADAALNRQIERIIDGRRAVVIFRLTRPFTRAGLTTDLKNHRIVLVDIDDRVEQVRDRKLAARIGEGWPLKLARRLMLDPLRRYLARRLRKTSLAWVCGEEDLGAYEGVNTAIARNIAFVDLPKGGTDMRPPSSGSTVLFVGTGGFDPNTNGMTWFLQHCWPLILKDSPDTRLDLVGGGPWRQNLGNLLDQPNVDARGYVENLGPLYEQARVAICPIFTGGGSKVKVIEACAYGRPIVLASHSTRALGPELGSALTIADSPQDFAEACLGFLRDGALADATGARLQSLQQKHLSRDVVQRGIAKDIGGFVTVRQELAGE